MDVWQDGFVSTVYDGYTTSGDIAIHGRDATVQDVIPQNEGLLAHPIPRRVKVTGLQWLEHWHDALNVCFTMLLTDGIELRLKSISVHLVALCSPTFFSSI